MEVNKSAQAVSEHQAPKIRMSGFQAAIGRKYTSDGVQYNYIDINQTQSDAVQQAYVEKIIEEDLFYPVVWINDKMVAEGIPRLKPIYQALEELGLEEIEG